MAWTGLYINLDRSKERRRRLESHLAALGLAGRYRRVAGIDAQAQGRPGHEGCFQSHVNALGIGYETGADLVHIIEDDAELSPAAATFLASERATAMAASVDILFLGMWMDAERVDTYRAAKPKVLASDFSNLATLDLRGQRIGAMDSYVVSRAAIPKVLWFLNLPAARRWAIDAALNFIVQEGGLKAAVTVPFLTTIDENDGIQSLVQSMPAGLQRDLLALRQHLYIGNAIG
jgi:GR25 family glycosyltransferase involved in LPS biosynthesis